MCSISSFNSNSSEGSHSPQRSRRRHRKPMQMFDSRHIESLITYHPQTSSSASSETSAAATTRAAETGNFSSSPRRTAAQLGHQCDQSAAS